MASNGERISLDGYVQSRLREEYAKLILESFKNDFFAIKSRKFKNLKHSSDTLNLIHSFLSIPYYLFIISYFESLAFANLNRKKMRAHSTKPN